MEKILGNKNSILVKEPIDPEERGRLQAEKDLSVFKENLTNAFNDEDYDLRQEYVEKIQSLEFNGDIIRNIDLNDYMESSIKKSFIVETLANLTFKLLDREVEDWGIKMMMIDVVASKLDVYEDYTKELDKLMVE